MGLYTKAIALAVGIGATVGGVVVAASKQIEVDKLKEQYNKLADEVKKEQEKAAENINQETIDKAVDDVLDTVARTAATVSVEAHHIINKVITPEIKAEAHNICDMGLDLKKRLAKKFNDEVIEAEKAIKDREESKDSDNI